MIYKACNFKTFYASVDVIKEQMTSRHGVLAYLIVGYFLLVFTGNSFNQLQFPLPI